MRLNTERVARGLETISLRQARLALCSLAVVAGCLWVIYERLFAPHQSAEAGFFACLGCGAIAWLFTSPRAERIVGMATAESLAAIRILICTILLVMTLWIEDVPSSALLPLAMQHSMGVLRYFYAIPGFASFVRSQAGLQVFEWGLALVLFLGAVGWRTRWVIPLGAVGYLLLGGIIRQYTWFFHTGLIPTYVLFVLALTPCGDALSIDRTLRIRRGAPVVQSDRPLPVYGWSRYACWLVIALPYVAAGASKLRRSGVMWSGAINMKAKIFASTLDPMQFDWGVALHLTQAPDVLFALLGIVGVYGELLYGTVLFSRIARWIMPTVMGLTHLGILFLQNIFFFDLIFLQLIFVDFTSVRKAIARRFKMQDTSREPNPPGAATERPSIVARLRYPLLVSVLITLLSFCWFYRVEFYPLTAMQMFSGKTTSGAIGYMKVLGHYDSGVVERIYPERIIPALFDTRYRLTLKGCFAEELQSVQTCGAFLETVAAVHNRTAEPGHKLAQIEIQRWQWNFLTEPTHPNYGRLAKRHVVEVPVAIAQDRST